MKLPLFFVPLYDASVYTDLVVSIRHRLQRESVSFVRWVPKASTPDQWDVVDLDEVEIIDLWREDAMFLLTAEATARVQESNDVESAYTKTLMLGHLQLCPHTIQSAQDMTLSIGMNQSGPTFAVQLDPELLRTLNPNRQSRPLSGAEAQEASQFQANMERGYQHMTRVAEALVSPKWARPELRTNNFIFDLREIRVWEGSWIPLLFHPQYQRETRYTSAHHQFFLDSWNLALRNHGLPPLETPNHPLLTTWVTSSFPAHQRKVRLLFAAALCAPARTYLYGSDQTVRLRENTQQIDKDRAVALEQESSKSWRVKTYGLRRVHIINAPPVDDTTHTLPWVVDQAGDQLIQARVAMDQARLQTDCEDANLVNAQNVMHFGGMYKSPHASQLDDDCPPVLLPLVKWTQQYVPVLCCCTLLVNGDLPLRAQQEYLIPSRASLGTRAAGRTTIDVANGSYEDHVTAMAFPIGVLQELVRRGRGAKPQPIKVSPILSLEGTDVFPGDLGSDLEDNEWGFVTPEFEDLMRTMPHRLMWQIPGCAASSRGARKYGWGSSMYVAEEVDGFMGGQLFWVHLSTGQRGIPLRDVLGSSETLLDPRHGWMLSPLVPGPLATSTPAFYKALVREEPRGACYQSHADDEKMSSFHPPPEPLTQSVWIYCREVDWNTYAQDFLEWGSSSVGWTPSFWDESKGQWQVLTQSHQARLLWVSKGQPVRAVCMRRLGDL